MKRPEIQKDVPLKGKAARNKTERCDWSFIKQMQKGDSFVVENERLARNAYHAGRNRGFTMRLRKTSDGYRVWRL